MVKLHGLLVLDPLHSSKRHMLTAIDSFQSRDWLEDLEGKTSIELQHKRVHFSSVSQPQIFVSPLKRIKKVFLNKMQVLAICNPYPRQYFNHKQCDKML